MIPRMDILRFLLDERRVIVFPKEERALKIGLDVGSTTIKCVVLDDADNLIYSTYERHFSHILEKSEELLRRVAGEYVPDRKSVV